MDLYHYIAILWRRKWAITITFVVTVAIVVGGSLVMTPVCEATTTLRVPTVPLESTQSVYYSLQYADRLLNTYRTIATSDLVLEQLVRRFGLSEPPEVTVKILARTELMGITVRIHISHILQKLHIQNRSQAAAYARQMGLLD